jgi:hypothetical protein
VAFSIGGDTMTQDNLFEENLQCEKMKMRAEFEERMAKTVNEYNALMLAQQQEYERKHAELVEYYEYEQDKLKREIMQYVERLNKMRNDRIEELNKKRTYRDALLVALQDLEGYKNEQD